LKAGATFDYFCDILESARRVHEAHNTIYVTTWSDLRVMRVLAFFNHLEEQYHKSLHTVNAL
jgi:uncharacterized protein YktA (UPF0223 family)